MQKVKEDMVYSNESLQPMERRKEERKEGVKICMFVVICYNSFIYTKEYNVC